MFVLPGRKDQLNIQNIIKTVSEKTIRYNNTCRELLTDRQFLARLLKGFVPEFRDLEIEYIANECIEPAAIVPSSIPVERNLTNIVGSDTADTSLNEGTVYYDILFSAVYPEKGRPGSARIRQRADKKIGLIINIEMQNDINPGYPLEKRGVYYAARRLTAQLGTLSSNTSYEGLQKVYSIWLCIGDKIPRNERNTATMYTLKEIQLIGDVHKEPERYDLLSVIMLKISDQQPTDDPTLELFAKFFSKKLSKDEKIEYFEKTGIYTADMKEGVETMCNLGEGLVIESYYDGVEKGKAEGRAEKAFDTLISLVRKGLLSVSDAAEEAEVTEEEFMQKMNTESLAAVKP